MNNMALLLATKNWGTMEIFQDFLATNSQAVWRINSKYSEEWINEIPFPVNLYFFHKNRIEYKATCISISNKDKWGLVSIPPDFHNDSTPYSTFIEINKLQPINTIHIKKFPKWRKPGEHYITGQLGLLKVADLEGGVKQREVFELEDSNALEGYQSDKRYLYTNRNRKIVEERKAKDDYTCQACRFRLKIDRKYIIECHHKIPFINKKIRSTTISDLVCLCPTCHRIAHTRVPPFTLNEIRKLQEANS